MCRTRCFQISDDFEISFSLVISDAELVVAEVVYAGKLVMDRVDQERCSHQWSNANVERERQSRSARVFIAMTMLGVMVAVLLVLRSPDRLALRQDLESHSDPFVTIPSSEVYVVVGNHGNKLKYRRTKLTDQELMRMKKPNEVVSFFPLFFSSCDN